MIWLNFPIFAILTIALWFAGVICLYAGKSNFFKILGNFLIVSGIVVLSTFIIILWINLQRPPLRTLGETRLWYSFFLPLIGYITYLRWKYKWFLAYCVSLAFLFLLLDILKPETYSKTLMPALQSPWFVPHVIVYIVSYALLGASSLVAVFGLYTRYKKIYKEATLQLADNLVYVGFSFLTLGLLFGALWAKVAWGHYWTWDPKETWAFLTWISYLIYMHFRHQHPEKSNTLLWVLSLSFAVLLICWFGINYLPSAANSVHVYSNG